MDAADVTALRLQAIALAFAWLAAREFKPDHNGRAWHLVRPADLGLKPDAMQGLRIRVSLEFEIDF